MLVKVIISLGLSLSCQVRPGQTQMYPEPWYPPSIYISLANQNRNVTSPINPETNGTQTGQNEMEDYGFHKPNGFVTEHFPPPPVIVDRPLLQSQPVPEFQTGSGTPYVPGTGTLNGIGGQPVLLSSPSQMFWHVGIYSRYYIPYMQICGGTLVTTKAVISAAHCFWGDVEGALPAASFAVGAGKRYRPWDDDQDIYSQKSDVEEIHIPVRYRDAATSYQEDIAVLLLATWLRPIEGVKPACVNFDEEFDDDQLKNGNMGVILGWGLTKEDGNPSQVLNYLELPAVGIEECMASADAGFLRYLTSDKICAGVTTGKAVCRGDSGGGLVFFDSGGARTPYLRGVASTAPRNAHRCNAHALAALTHLRAHRAFLRRHIPGLEAECKKHYPYADAPQDRYGKYEQKSPEQPIQLICNCFCNNTQPSHDEY